MKVKRMTEVETNRPKIGDRISFKLKTGEKVEAMAVRELINGTVFCTVDYLDQAYPMNRKGGTREGYEASDLRKELNGAILSSFPDDIKERLVPFDNGDILTIPSEREMFGKNIFAEEDEGDVMQWEPMADRHNRIALRNGGTEWGWLRNVAASTDFASCSAAGLASDWDASDSRGVRPVFQIACEPITKIKKLKRGEKEMINFDDKSMEIVKDYITEHLDKSDPMPNFTVFTVWKCKILQNWKYLISSSIHDGMYYELTYNGDKHEWYLDAYKKFENRVVKQE